VKTLIQICIYVLLANSFFCYGVEKQASTSEVVPHKKKIKTHLKAEDSVSSLISPPSKQKAKIIIDGNDISISKNPNSTNPKQTDLSKTQEDPIKEEPQHSISEDFAPQDKEQIDGVSVIDSFLEDVSWFFQKKQTRHKIGFSPDYSYNKSQGSRLGLRLFTFSPKKKGYYFSIAGSKYLHQPFEQWIISYISNRESTLRSESSLTYDNHYENYYGEGMSNSLEDVKKLYANRLLLKYKLIYQAPNQSFYLGLGAELHYRNEKPEFQKNQETYFDKEFFLFFKSYLGYDSRNRWKNTSEGVFHQISFACKSILAFPGAYCRGELDLRFYTSLFKNTNYHDILKNSAWALRAFTGSSFLSRSTYSTAYSLSGWNTFQNIKSLRGFKYNRFRGDKIYFIQSEYRLPLIKNYLQGALFAEMGEVAAYKQPFKNFVIDYGGGLRLGVPQDKNMKLRLDVGTGLDTQGIRNYNFIIAFFQAF